MKRWLLPFIVFLFATPAWAQNGSPKTSAALTNEINTLIASNTTQAITAADLRQVYLDIVASMLNAVAFGANPLPSPLPDLPANPGSIWATISGVPTIGHAACIAGSTGNYILQDCGLLPGIGTVTSLNPSTTGLTDWQNVQSGSYTTSTPADCNGTVFFTAFANTTYTLNAPAGFPANCRIIVSVGPNSPRGVILSISGAVTPTNYQPIIAPGQTVVITNLTATNWQVSQMPRWRLPGNFRGQSNYEWFVDGTAGSDTAADGLAAGSGAFRTCQKAMDYIADNVDINGQNVVIQVNDASQCGSGLTLRAVLGVYDFWPNSTLLLRGNISAPVAWVCASTCITGVNVRTGWRIDGFAFTLSGGGVAINADAGTHVYPGTNTYNGSTTTSPIVSSVSSFVEMVGTSTINLTSYQAFVQVGNGGTYQPSSTGLSVVINSTATFGAFYYLPGPGGYINVQGVTYSGAGATTSTGTTFGLAPNGAAIVTGGKCASTGGSGLNLPGNVAGTFTSGFCS